VFDCFRCWSVYDSRHLGLGRGPTLYRDIESEELHLRKEHLALRPLDEEVMFLQSVKNYREFEEVLGRRGRQTLYSHDQEVIAVAHAVSCCNVFMEDVIH